MVNKDLDAVVRDLNRRFDAPLPEFYQRRILFWHDEDRDFEERIKDIQIENVKIITLTDRNMFKIKKLLAADDTDHHYLVYRTASHERPDDDWLINMELYSEEFRADLISIWMDEIKIAPTPTFRNLVKEYKKFFNAQPRRAAFAKMNQDIRTAPEFHLTVMAVISGAAKAETNAIFRAALNDDLETENNAVYQKMKEYGADKAFRKLTEQAFGYTADEEFSLSDLVIHIILTAAEWKLGREYLTGLERFISTTGQSRCRDFVSEWLQTADNHRLWELARMTEDAVRLPERLGQAPLSDLTPLEVFPCADESILTLLMTEIVNQNFDADTILDAAQTRRTAAWYSSVSLYYEGLTEIAGMQKFRLDHASGFHTVEPQKVWKAYAEDYYRMDTFYRRFHLAFAKSLKEGNELLDDLFKQVADWAEGVYKQWFLKQLGDNWSNAAEEELKNKGAISHIPQQTGFYQEHIAKMDSRVFVIISDAFRYEAAVALAEELQRESRCKVSLDCVEGIFPTVTKFGMAALLPHKKLTVAERGGSLAVLADGLPTDAGSREKALQAANPKSIALQYKNIVRLKRSERSPLVKGMNVVYIYHDRVDESSHTSDSSVFRACDEAADEIKNMVRIIVNEFSGKHIYITADHGFLYTNSPLPEGDKVDKTTPCEDDVEIERRYLITRKGAAPDFLMPVKLTGDADPYAAFTPREGIRIKKKGGGLNYVHGGASLQEMAVPLIHYYAIRSDSKAYRQNKNQYDTKPVAISLLSAGRKISNMNFSLNFYQSEPVGAHRKAATYILYFTDESGEVVSDRVKMIADKTDSDQKDRIFRSIFELKSRRFKNTEPYYLVITDESGKQIPQREEFQIDIAFAVEEFHFFD